MKFLITGGSGFLGQTLISRLTNQGHRVVLAGRQFDGADTEQCSFVKADITQIETLQDCKKAHPDIDMVVHLAALVPKTRDEDVLTSMGEVNVLGTCNLLDVFGADIRNFVYASTAEVYGLPDTNEPLKETRLPAPLSYYGASKLAGEYFCSVYAQRHNLPTSMLRFSVMYGPGDRIHRAVPNFIKKALQGESLEVFGGEELRDYLHVVDAAEAVYLAATSQADGVINIGTGRGISIRDTAAAIVAAVEPSLRVAILPREKKSSDIVLDTRKATRLLRFTPKYLFPELLEEQIEWQRNN